jgi:two-component system response regulator HydG
MFSKKHGKKIKGVTQEARRRLFAYDWPGNVRQLRNAIESMVVVDFDELLDVDDLPEEMTERDEVAEPTAGATLARLVGKPMAEVERLFIAETLQAASGNREEAAKMLGIGERTLYRKIKEYELT